MKKSALIFNQHVESKLILFREKLEMRMKIEDSFISQKNFPLWGCGYGCGVVDDQMVG